MHVDAPTGTLLIADVGQSTAEEVNILGASGGVNFGWPWYEGFGVFNVNSCGGIGGAVVAPPAYAYPNPPTAATAVISAGIYRNPPGAPWAFGPAYEGDAFVADYYDGGVRRLRNTGGTWGLAPPAPGQPTGSLWAAGIGGLTDAAVGPDGALYYTKHGFVGSGVRRIRPTSIVPTLSIVSGDQQAATAGWPFFEPLTVSLSLGGSPLANAPVDFAVVAGSASVGPMPVFTDAGGVAQVVPTPYAGSTDDVVIVAATPGSGAVTFTTRWRGLIATFDDSTGTLSAVVKHSANGVPVILAFDDLPDAPYFSGPFGDLWMSVLDPGPGYFAVDGFGLNGPPNPAAVTAASGPPLFTFSVPNIPPLGGFFFGAQAYAHDPALLYPASEMLSNLAYVYLP
jgi:hypothetical protein